MGKMSFLCAAGSVGHFWSSGSVWVWPQYQRLVGILEKSIKGWLETVAVLMRREGEGGQSHLLLQKIFEGRVQIECSQAVRSGAQWQTKGNGHKQAPGRRPLNIRKQFFISGVAEHWYRLPREECGISIIGDFQKLSGHGPGQLSVPASASGSSRWHPEVPYNLSPSVTLCIKPSSPAKARAEGRGAYKVFAISPGVGTAPGGS